MQVLKEMRYLLGATTSREKKHFVKIVKNVRKDCGVDVVMHLGPNNLSKQKVYFLCRRISRA